LSADFTLLPIVVGSIFFVAFFVFHLIATSAYEEWSRVVYLEDVEHRKHRDRYT